MPHLNQAVSFIETSVTTALNVPTPVQNSLVFVQTDDLGYFLLDESQTYADPDPLELGHTVYFTVTGLWTQPVDIDHVNFSCKLFGVLAYNEDFPDFESV